MADRLTAVINNEGSEGATAKLSYQNAVVDEELFLLSTAACLQWFYAQQDTEEACLRVEQLKEITSYIQPVLKLSLIHI